MIMRGAIPALVPTRLALFVFVVPLGCDFEHFGWAFVFAAFHNDAFAGVNSVDVCTKLFVFIHDALAW